MKLWIRTCQWMAGLIVVGSLVGGLTYIVIEEERLEDWCEARGGKMADNTSICVKGTTILNPGELSFD